MNITEDPIPELVRKIAVPASVGFFFNTMFNFVDTYFGGQISTDALAALSLSFPVFFIILSIGSGLGQGATALVANALGAWDEDKARRYVAQAMVFCVIASVVVSVTGLAAAPGLFRLLGASGDYLVICLQYMNVIILGSLAFLMQGTLSSVLNAKGETRVFRNALIGSFVANCLLDPWFLYGGWGMPAMGIAGLAWATVLCQAGSAIYLLAHVRRTQLWPGLSWATYKPDVRILREIASQAIPASLNMLTVALGIFVITWFISRFSKEGVAAYGIATRIEQMFHLPTIGLDYAVLVLVGQNNGAGRLDRVVEAWRISLKYGLYQILGGGVLMFLLRQPLMRLFTNDGAVIAHGTTCLGVASLTMGAYVILYLTIFMLQGLKRPMFGLWIGLYRQVVAPLCVFHLLAFTLAWNLPGIWWGIFLVTWSAALFALGYGIRVLRAARG